MKLPTKDRYAVMAIVDLALHSTCGKPVTLQAISARQNISLTYLERIFISLRRNGIVASVKGPGGGYVLSKDPGAVSISEVLRAMDSRSFKMTRCSRGVCVSGVEKCLTHKIWASLGASMNAHLSAISINDVINNSTGVL